LVVGVGLSRCEVFFFFFFCADEELWILQVALKVNKAVSY